jgi:hypothetical protein
MCRDNEPGHSWTPLVTQCSASLGSFLYREKLKENTMPMIPSIAAPTKQREQWRPVLEAEMKRWSAMSCAQLASQLAAQLRILFLFSRDASHRRKHRDLYTSAHLTRSQHIRRCLGLLGRGARFVPEQLLLSDLRLIRGGDRGPLFLSSPDGELKRRMARSKESSRTSSSESVKVR